MSARDPDGSTDEYADGQCYPAGVEVPGDGDPSLLDDPAALAMCLAPAQIESLQRLNRASEAGGWPAGSIDPGSPTFGRPAKATQGVATGARRLRHRNGNRIPSSNRCTDSYNAGRAFKSHQIGFFRRIPNGDVPQIKNWNVDNLERFRPSIPSNSKL